MGFLNSQVVIANSSFAAKVERLRGDAYHNSQGFKIVDEQEFDKYCKWSDKDVSGTVLLALNEESRPVSTLRGNIYFSQQELENNNPNFLENSIDFISFPVLDMTFAATCPSHFQNGLLSVLRYYMYVLHRNTVKTVTGTAVKNSSIYKTLEKFGYEFKEIDKYRKGMTPIDTMTIAKIDTDKLDFAISYLKEKYAATIEKYPLMVS